MWITYSQDLVNVSNLYLIARTAQVAKVGRQLQSDVPVTLCSGLATGHQRAHLQLQIPPHVTDGGVEETVSQPLHDQRKQ